MQRITITLDDALLREVDGLGYANRSEAVRDLVRAGLQQEADARQTTGPCTAALAYVYDHHRRDLPGRLTESFHDHHDLSVATLHVHLDDHACLEVAVLRGNASTIRHFANAVKAERGVQHGRLLLLAPSKVAAPSGRGAG
ncbi:nickel-responsive transcriptional regulator NikR [Teichococcus vastitatis]|uniref:Putative nickel-responsive regulator n=1 Tax=Teichococcus vastitatis TaxID=2307076 RepID=A0ABS9WCT7_9PROT|nr:nickel-responsive transcriptional regulator NikR [Pseudoroseomonas vastitatis]MCI0757130.1 nickel-responsive transcriptional regulator NikR [Pseudoroseomonas vastitatis]